MEASVIIQSEIHALLADLVVSLPHVMFIKTELSSKQNQEPFREPARNAVRCHISDNEDRSVLMSPGKQVSTSFVIFE